MRGEQLREHVGHRPAVLDDVRDARRDAQVVLEHAHLSVGVADEVDARDVHAHAARRRDPAAHGAVEVRRRDDEAAGHDARSHDLARPYTSSRKRSSARTRCATPRSISDHSLARDDAGHEVERERPLLARVRVRDALVAEHPVAGRAPLVEVDVRTASARARRASGSRPACRPSASNISSHASIGVYASRRSPTTSTLPRHQFGGVSRR